MFYYQIISSKAYFINYKSGSLYQHIIRWEWVVDCPLIIIIKNFVSFIYLNLNVLSDKAFFHETQLNVISIPWSFIFNIQYLVLETAFFTNINWKWNPYYSGEKTFLFWRISLNMVIKLWQLLKIIIFYMLKKKTNNCFCIHYYVNEITKIKLHSISKICMGIKEN